MTAAIIHQRVLEDLRSRRGLIERRERNCLTCSREFVSLGPWNCICETCRIDGRPMLFEEPAPPGFFDDYGEEDFSLDPNDEAVWNGEAY